MSIRSALCAATVLSLLSMSAYAHGSSPQSAPAVGSDATAGKLTAGMVVDFIKMDAFSDAELAAYAADHVHAHSVDYVLMKTASLSYTATDRLMLSLSVPHIYRDNVRASSHAHGGGGAVINTAEEMGDSTGMGDIMVTGRYDLFDGPVFRAGIVAGLKMPTGRTDVQIGGEKLEAEHQPGSGSWDGMGGFLVGATVGDLALDAGVSYVLVTEGTQDTDLGDRLQYNAALSHPVATGWDMTLDIDGEWSRPQRVAGEIEENSGGNQILLSPGMRFSPGGGVTLFGAVGVPVVSNLGRGHAETDYRVVIGAGKTF